MSAPDAGIQGPAATPAAPAGGPSPAPRRWPVAVATTAGLLIVLVGLVVKTWLYEKRADEGWKALEEKLEASETPSVEALAELRKGYPGTRVYPWILAHLGKAQFLAKQYAEARSTWEELAADASAPPELQGLGRLHAARTLEAEGRYKEAAAAFARVAETAPLPFFQVEGLLEQGRCLRLAGQREEAAMAYQQARVRATEVKFPTSLLPRIEDLVAEARLSPERYGPEEVEPMGPPAPEPAEGGEPAPDAASPAPGDAPAPEAAPQPPPPGAAGPAADAPAAGASAPPGASSP